MPIRIALLAVLFAAAPAAAQDAGPRAAVRAFLKDMDQARDGDDEALARAVGRRDLGEIARGDRERLGRSAARDLYNTLLRVERAPLLRSLSMAESADSYRFETRYGTFGMTQGDGGRWRFSQETVARSRELYESAGDDPVAGGLAEYRDSSSVLREWVPHWLRGRLFLLHNWQWVALFGLIVLGLFFGWAGRLAAFGIARRIARRRGVELKEAKRIGRPFGLVAMAAVWLAGLPLLDLPASAYSALMLAARFVLMVVVVWSVCQIIDWAAEVLEKLARGTDTRIDDLLVPMVRKATKVFAVALGIVWIADNMGMNVASLLAGLGIGGLALALASRDTVENFFGAIAILADHPFQVGDWIKMGDIEGTVESVGFRSTRVRTFYDSLVSFPNAMLIRTEVDNLGARRYRRFSETIGVTYDTPADRLEAFLEGIRELIRRHPYTRRDYYLVYFKGFGASSLDVLVYGFLACPDWATEMREKQRLLLDIVRLAERLGVGFAFPTRTLHLFQEEASPPPDALGKPEREGRGTARDIVAEFTGSKRPPPVDFGPQPDDAVDDAGDAGDG